MSSRQKGPSSEVCTAFQLQQTWFKSSLPGLDDEGGSSAAPSLPGAFPDLSWPRHGLVPSLPVFYSVDVLVLRLPVPGEVARCTEVIYSHDQKLGTRVTGQLLKEVSSVRKVSCERVR